jgi:hypothetical protein
VRNLGLRKNIVATDEIIETLWKNLEEKEIGKGEGTAGNDLRIWGEEEIR